MNNKKQLTNFNSAEALISQAISQNVSVDSLEKLLNMRTQLKAEYAKEQFIKNLSAFQGECPIIEKKKKVSFGTTNYSYAPLEDIVEQVKGLLAKYGFSYMFDTETNGKMKVICKVVHIDGHMELAKFDMEIDANAKMNVSQKYGSSLTYAKRYAFCAAFGITVKDEDTDAQNPLHDTTDHAVSVKQDIDNKKSYKETGATIEQRSILSGLVRSSKINSIPKEQWNKLTFSEAQNIIESASNDESQQIADEVEEALNS